MGKVIYPRKGEVHTTPVTIPAVFADATWAQIIEACETNTVPATWEVGDQKTMTINGKDYPIDIIGKNHDVYSDGSGYAPLTFQMHDCYGALYKMYSTNSNSVGWTNCDMRKTHLPALLSLMPLEVQAGIKEVTKVTVAGSQSSTISTVIDKLFLISEAELIGGRAGAKAEEGSQYAYYAAGNSKTKNYNGTAANWWTRTPYGSNSTSFCAWLAANYSGGVNASYNNGVAFAFCF